MQCGLVIRRTGSIANQPRDQPMTSSIKIAVMRGDGIGVDVTDAALAVTDAALARCGLPPYATNNIDASTSYFAATGPDIEPDG